MTLSAPYTPHRAPRVRFDPEVGSYRLADFGLSEPERGVRFAKAISAFTDLLILATVISSLVLLAMCGAVLIGAVS